MLGLISRVKVRLRLGSNRVMNIHDIYIYIYSANRKRERFAQGLWRDACITTAATAQCFVF